MFFGNGISGVVSCIAHSRIVLDITVTVLTERNVK
jgi:hypothetical protein